jgi:hypothetical protein
MSVGVKSGHSDGAWRCPRRATNGFLRAKKKADAPFRLRAGLM